jgi:hypothetical protein
VLTARERERKARYSRHRHARQYRASQQTRTYHIDRLLAHTRIIAGANQQLCIAPTNRALVAEKLHQARQTILDRLSYVKNIKVAHFSRVPDAFPVTSYPSTTLNLLVENRAAPLVSQLHALRYQRSTRRTQALATTLLMRTPHYPLKHRR